METNYSNLFNYSLGQKIAKFLLSVEININKGCCTTISKLLTIDIKFCEVPVLYVNSELIIIIIIIIIIITQ